MAKKSSLLTLARFKNAIARSAIFSTSFNPNRGRFVDIWYHSPASPDRAPYRPNREVIAMETIAAIVMFAVVLVIVGVALDAARRAK